MTDAPREPKLPDRVIVFDGVCTLCSRCVRYILQRDAHALFHFTPLQSATGAALLRRHGIDPRDVRTFLLIKAGTAYLRSAAVIKIATDLHIGGWLPRLLRIVPRAWRDALYDLIARNRYRWFGRQQHCKLPDDRIRARFLD